MQTWRLASAADAAVRSAWVTVCPPISWPAAAIAVSWVRVR